MTPVINPQLTLHRLDELEERIKSNKALVEEYQELDNFLSSIGFPNYLLNDFRRYNVFSFEQYQRERNRTSGKNPAVEGYLLGVLIGSINTLRKYLQNTL